LGRAFLNLQKSLNTATVWPASPLVEVVA
jgi:hypothetical protein